MSIVDSCNTVAIAVGEQSGLHIQYHKHQHSKRLEVLKNDTDNLYKICRVEVYDYSIW